jgi:aminoglycoside phosphotransferase family enzyme/predicted kinase
MAPEDAAPSPAMQRHAALLRHWCRHPPWADDAPPTLVQTHLSSLLLGRQWVLKLKKPLALDFVDFRDAERRRQACEDELRLNRRTAAHWYVDVLPVSGSADAPRLGASGDAADAPWDWALRMRRFDETATYDRLAAAGTLGEAQIDALAARVAAFHRALPPSPAAWGDPQAALAFALANLRTLAAALPALPESTAALAALRDWTGARHAAIVPVLARRRAQGRVREGHGDLHLGNVAWIDGDALPFDALEFDPRLRHLDLVGDAAFAFADLLDHGLPALAWRYVGGWVEACGEHDGLPLLRWFAAYRALVRAKVAAIRAQQPDADALTAAAATAAAQRRVRLALALAQPPRPRLVLTCGLSGSGKSSVAQRLAERLGGVRVRSDVERKRLHGLAPTARPADPATLYHPAATQRTYARLLTVARWAADGDVSLVVDAAYLKRAERDAMRALAKSLGVEATIVECRAPAPVLHERLARRAAEGRDPSDATAAVLALQQRVHEPTAPEEGAITLDTDAPLAEVAARVDALAARLAGAAAG